MDCPAVPNLADRIFQLYGKDVLDRLMEVGTENDGRRLDGYASLPLTGRNDRSVQHFFVNNRPVKDRTLLAALGQAYSGMLEKNKYPEGFLFISLPYEEVDVNVHPAKTEVRFRDSQAVFRLVLRAIEAAAGRGPMVKGVRTAGGADAPPQGHGLEASSPGLFRSGPEPVARPFGSVGEGPSDFAAKAAEYAGQGPAGPAGPVVLGQYDNLYIIAVSADGLLVIDQHNAHERVLFEKFMEIDRAKQWPGTMMLVPEVMDLSPAESLRFDENGTLLEELGFRADRMGGRTVALKEYPAIFGPKAARETFLGLLGEKTGPDKLEVRRKMLATMACKSAIKAGQPLSPQQMGSLVAELFKTAQPALCPHGRPVVLKIDKSEIERELGRPVRPDKG
jgi:DNA mismatch repair enzyme (predicted ATPase)